MNGLQKGKNITIREGCRIGDNVTLGDDVYLDYNCIIRDNVTLGRGTVVGANCVVGEYLAAWYADHSTPLAPTVIGEGSILRSNSVVYAGVTAGAGLQTGHHVTIREETVLGAHCSVGSYGDIQNRCTLGDYVRLQSGVFLCGGAVVEDYVWIFPHVVTTDDPTPPSEVARGPLLRKFAVVAADSLLLPGVEVESDAVVAAGAVVTKKVKSGTVVAGNPAKVLAATDHPKNRETGANAYPWRYTFDRYMPWAGIGYEAWLAGQDGGKE